MKHRARESKSGAILLCALVCFSWVLSTTFAKAGNCLARPPRPFELASDTVHWAIQLTSGGNCIQGLRYMSMVIEDVSIAGRPREGNLTIQGPSFRYEAKPEFQGTDSFVLSVRGLNRGAPGASFIHVNITVGTQGRKGQRSASSDIIKLRS
jgi:hypothetical protein